MPYAAPIHAGAYPLRGRLPRARGMPLVVTLHRSKPCRAFLQVRIVIRRDAACRRQQWHNRRSGGAESVRLLVLAQVRLDSVFG